MDVTMTDSEIRLARQIVGLQGRPARATGNRLRDLTIRQMPVMASLSGKGHVVLHDDGYWRMTGPGIQQLRAQIGQFGMTRSMSELVRGKARPEKPIRVKFGKGVLAKDNRTPYAPGTITATSADGMMYPCVFSYEAVARLLADDDVREIRIIDRDNVQSTITKNWIENKPSRLAQMLKHEEELRSSSCSST